MLKINKVSIVMAMLGFLTWFAVGSALAVVTITGGSQVPAAGSVVIPGETIQFSVTATGLAEGDVLTGTLYGPYGSYWPPNGAPIGTMVSFTLVREGTTDTYSYTLTVPDVDVNGDPLQFGNYSPGLKLGTTWLSDPPTWGWVTWKPDRIPPPAPSNLSMTYPYIRSGGIANFQFDLVGEEADVVYISLLVTAGTAQTEVGQLPMYRVGETATYRGQWIIPYYENWIRGKVLTPLPEVRYTVYLTNMQDPYNNTNWDWSAFNQPWVDNTPPVVTITSPADGAMLPSAALPIHGTISDVTLHTPLTSVDVAINTQTLDVATDGSFGGTVFHPKTGMDITVTATDAAGNVGSDTVYDVSQIHDMRK